MLENIKLTGRAPLSIKMRNVKIVLCRKESKTQCKNEGRIQSDPVPKNLTIHRMSKIEFQPEFRNPQMLSFLNMYNTMGSKMDGLAVREHFLSKMPKKTAFWSDTNHDHPTLEGHNSLNFKD